MDDGCSLCDSLVDSFHQHQISSRYRPHLNSVPSLKQVQLRHISHKKILFISRHIIFTHYLQFVILFDCSRKYPAKHVKSFIIFRVVHLHCVYQQRSISWSSLDSVQELSCRSSIMSWENSLWSLCGNRNVVNQTLCQTSRSSEILFHDEFDQGFDVEQILVRIQYNF